MLKAITKSCHLYPPFVYAVVFIVLVWSPFNILSGEQLTFVNVCLVWEFPLTEKTMCSDSEAFPTSGCDLSAKHWQYQVSIWSLYNDNHLQINWFRSPEYIFAITTTKNKLLKLVVLDMKCFHSIYKVTLFRRVNTINTSKKNRHNIWRTPLKIKQTIDQKLCL